MTPQEYRMVCDRILVETLKYVDPARFAGRAPKLATTDVPNAIHASAVTDTAPVTLVYTPAGSRKSKLVRDRANALVAAGMAPENIIVLNMNIAKANQMARELPGMAVMTFNDFIEGLFVANFPEVTPSDSGSVVNALKLLPASPESGELIRKLSIRNPQEQAVMTALHVNEKTDQVLGLVRAAGIADGQLQSLLCQNYDLQANPYEAEAVIVNGVHNMPLPVLCCVLAYANKHGCNLFLTGSPKETIYEFNMAYGGAMDVLSGWNAGCVHVVNLLDRDAISDGIQAALEMDEHAVIPADEVGFEYHANVRQFGQSGAEDIVKSLACLDTWLARRIALDVPVLVVANSKTDLAALKESILEKWLPVHPGLKVVDLTTVQYKPTPYGRVLADHLDAVLAAHPGTTTIWRLLGSLYDWLRVDAVEQSGQYARNYLDAADDLMNWYLAHESSLPARDEERPTRELVRAVIDAESRDCRAYLDSMKGSHVVDTSGADIILSTVHSAVDLRMDNVLAIVHQFGSRCDMNLLRVALSRAGTNEYLVFMDDSKSDNPYPRYLKTHLERS